MTQEPALTIVHVVRQFHPGVGGLENFVEQLATRQVVRGHRVRVVTLDRIFDSGENGPLPPRGMLRGVEIVRVPFRGSRRYPLAPGVLPHVRDADVIHVHAVDFLSDYLAATAPIHRRPMVLTTHGGFFHTRFAQKLKRAWFHTITRASLCQYGAVTACSAEDEQTFRGITDERLKLIPNAVDVDKFAGAAKRGSRTFIYFGRLAPNKELERVVDWFAGYAGDRAEARLLIAGKPMGVDPDALRERARAAGIGERVELHPSPSDEELRALIGCSGLYVCASSYEGFGLAAVEGASAGLFPLLSDIPPFADTIDRLGYGLLVDFADPTSWAASHSALDSAYARFTADHDAAAVEAAVAPFAWPDVVDQFDDVYDRVIGRTRRRIGAVTVDVTDRHSAAAQILSAAARRQPLLVGFCNAHTANLAQRDPALRDALDGALVLNDGFGVDIASRALFRQPFKENLNGTDFTPFLLGETDQPLRLFLVGSKPGIAEEAAAVLEKGFRNVRVVGVQHGFFRDQDSADLVRRIRASGANLVLLGMGQPRQEIWGKRHVAEIGVPVLCIGALLDFCSGRIPRAPMSVRKLRLEWAYRLAHEPRRLFGRYVVGNLTFLARAMRQKVAGSRI
ncbi:WecB/TagA/CpsF family glycosyltransferase [Sphingomonas ginkgonis]|nr:WecB/TagA/CpsF family glycosyltransferase [Sphingomonas ginkgonis]